MRKLITRIVLFCFWPIRRSSMHRAPGMRRPPPRPLRTSPFQGFVSTPSAGAVVPGLYQCAAGDRVLRQSQPEHPVQRPGQRVRELDRSGLPGRLERDLFGVAPKPPMGPYDPAIAGVRDIANNPGAILGDLSAYYAGCTTTHRADRRRIRDQEVRALRGAGQAPLLEEADRRSHDGAGCAPGTWVAAGTGRAQLGSTRCWCRPIAIRPEPMACRPIASTPTAAGTRASGGRRATCRSAACSAFQVLAPLSPHWEGSLRQSVLRRRGTQPGLYRRELRLHVQVRRRPPLERMARRSSTSVPSFSTRPFRARTRR